MTITTTTATLIIMTTMIAGFARWINPFEKSRIKPDGLNWLFSNEL
jgi:hypothetical protein